MERAGERRELSASRFSSSTGSDRLVPTIPLLVVAIAEQPAGSLAITYVGRVVIGIVCFPITYFDCY